MERPPGPLGGHYVQQIESQPPGQSQRSGKAAASPRLSLLGCGQLPPSGASLIDQCEQRCARSTGLLSGPGLIRGVRRAGPRQQEQATAAEP